MTDNGDTPAVLAKAPRCGDVDWGRMAWRCVEAVRLHALREVDSDEAELDRYTWLVRFQGVKGDITTRIAWLGEWHGSHSGLVENTDDVDWYDEKSRQHLAPDPATASMLRKLAAIVRLLDDGLDPLEVLP